MTGDKDAKYSAIMNAVDAIRRQIENIALIAVPEQALDRSKAGAGRR